MEDEDGGLKLVLVSSRLKNASSVISAAQSDVLCVHYKFDSCTTQLLKLVEEKVDKKQFSSLGLVMHSQGGGLVICGGKDREKILTCNKVNMIESEEWYLLSTIINRYVDNRGRLDIIATSLVKHSEGQALIDKIKQSVTVQVHGWPSFVEDEHGSLNPMYFDPEKLQHDSNARLFQPTLAEFEKIRTVGKGAYGAAVLYRKKDDDSLVILKEINMHELSYTERQLALNEVKVLGMLHHPNIISYYDSFEEDGTLMIEMEYADGGTLAQYLAAQEEDLPEYKILNMFRQMLEACKHLHDHNILHRDLKTQNIFLTKSEMIKLGDFGISKIIATKGASTVLGTPYYISPEMCEGKQYDDKSDVWALGCVLYEMTAREKAFEGSNLPALVNKIIKGQYKPVSNVYSSHMREIVDVLLSTEPEDRPTVDIILNQVLGLVQFYQHREKKLNAQEVVRSIIYYLDTSLLTLCPIDLPITTIIKTVSIGEAHIVATTEVHSTYSWGKGNSGQLGHGNRTSIHSPTSIDALQGKYVTSVACGSDFSLFVTDNGLLLSCGFASSKCLGHSDLGEDVLKPRLCEAMLSTDVVSVVCGLRHAALTTKNGTAFTWGCGLSGRLGHGNELDRILPSPVTFSEECVSVQKIRCGVDGTVFLTDDGTLYACGSNRYNKLGLNKRKGFLLAMKKIFYNKNEETEVQSVMVPTAVKLIANKRCIEVSVGATHSAVVVDTGQIYTFGLNKDGQLGTSNRGNSDSLMLVRAIEQHRAKFVACCSTYTVAVTDTDAIYLWGQPPPTNLEELSLRGVHLSDSDDSEMEIASPSTSTTPQKKTQSALVQEKHVYSGKLSHPKSLSDPDLHSSSQRSGAKSSRIRKTVSERNTLYYDGGDMRISPIEISLTDAAKKGSASGHPGLNHIKKLIGVNQSLLIQVSTTAPQKKKRKQTGRYMIASSEDNLASSERSESANHPEERQHTATPERAQAGGAADGARPEAGGLTPGRPGDHDDDQMRTWLRLELEAGVSVADKPASDLDTSGGLRSSNVHSTKSKDSGIDTIQIDKTTITIDNQNLLLDNKRKEFTDSDTQTVTMTLAEKDRSNKRRLRKKINAAVAELETTDSDEELVLSATKVDRYRLAAQGKRRGDPYRERFKLNWRDVRTNPRPVDTTVRPNKASELRAKNPSNVNSFKMRSPYSTTPVRTSAGSVATFSRELECVQEKAELLQEQLAYLEQDHIKQTKYYSNTMQELEEFKNTKLHLEEMFQQKWENLEREKEQTEHELTKYRGMLEVERSSAAHVQVQLETEVKDLQTQLESQKVEINNQTNVMFELKDVISTIQQRQNAELKRRSTICVIQ